MSYQFEFGSLTHIPAYTAVEQSQVWPGINGIGFFGAFKSNTPSTNGTAMNIKVIMARNSERIQWWMCLIWLNPHVGPRRRSLCPAAT